MKAWCNRHPSLMVVLSLIVMTFLGFMTEQAYDDREWFKAAWTMLGTVGWAIIMFGWWDKSGEAR